MSTKSREVLFGSRISGVKLRAEGANAPNRLCARRTRADAEWKGTAGQRRHSRDRAMPKWWLRLVADQMPSEASIPLEHIRRLRDPLIWKFEAALKC
jgi:hypothetical protein